MMGGMGQMDQYAATLTMLADDYSGTTAAKIATLRLANDNFTQKKYDDALKYFNVLSDKYSDDKMVATSAAAGKGACYELKGDYTQAGKFYQQAADFNSGDIWTPGYLLKAGQNFAKAGDKKSAQAAFDQIAKRFANSNENNIAKRSLAELLD
jgi:TolA-binding protein